MIFQDDLKAAIEEKNEEIHFLKELTKVLSPKSCDELASFGINTNGYYWIDLDGPRSGQPPVSVYCDFGLEPPEIGHIYQIGHDSEELALATENCDTEQCFNTRINYDINIEQVQQVINQSTSCSQKIYFHCNQAPIQVEGQIMIHWLDVHGQIQNFFHGDGSNGAQPVCSCGFYGACAKNVLGFSTECNCNALLHKWVYDVGEITSKNLLPIMGFSYGPLHSGFAQAKFSVGKLICNSQSSKVRNLQFPKIVNYLTLIHLHYLKYTFSARDTPSAPEIHLQYLKYTFSV